MRVYLRKISNSRKVENFGLETFVVFVKNLLFLRLCKFILNRYLLACVQI